MCVCACVFAVVCRQGSEDNFWESILSFHRVGLRKQTEVIRLGWKGPWLTLRIPVVLSTKFLIQLVCLQILILTGDIDYIII